MNRGKEIKRRTAIKRKKGYKRGDSYIDKVCPVCGNGFSVPPSHSFQKMCSYTCASTARRTKEQRTCAQCEIQFWFAPSQLKAYKGAGQYCSKKCHALAKTERGRVAPIKDRYGRSKRLDDLAWQKAVRERDGYTCQRCGKYESNIHAHHVATRARRPDLKHDVDNGKCLCNSCHSWVHHHPMESEEAGWLTEGHYELERLNLRNERIKMDDYDACEILRLHYEEKLRPGSIAERLGLGRRRVDRILMSYGIKPSPPGRPA